MSSELKTTNIKHADSSSNNLVLASDGTTTTTLSSSANIKSAINASGSAPIYACRAWVNFDGTNAFSPNPSTSAIRGSGNVSSITDNGVGDYTINFTTNLPDGNYVCNITANDNTNNIISGPAVYDNAAGGADPSTSAVRIVTPNSAAGNNDAAFILVSIFR